MLNLRRLRRFCVCLCFCMNSFVSFLVLQWERERTGCFSFILLRMSCYCKCSVALPQCHGLVFSVWLWYFQIILNFFLVLWVGLQFVIVLFRYHTHLRFDVMTLVFVLRGYWKNSYSFPALAFNVVIITLIKICLWQSYIALTFL